VTVAPSQYTDQAMDSNRLRRVFTDFFVERGHVAVPSGGLVPHHPRAPLFTNAGMNQFIPYFTGEERAPYPRATSVQKCVRIRGKHDDIENVGRTSRHATFFEMLGNFSFGDYFKPEAIPLAWELLTEQLGFDADRLWVTVFTDDDDGAAIWADGVGVPAARIQRMGEDNFWEMGETGPCGPCSEIYFDRGPQWGPDGGPAGGGEERFIEVWNLVFMQFDRQADGSFEPLPRPSIDTGAGFERLLTILQDVPTIWETDALREIIARAESVTGRHYGDDAQTDVALRILADHARSMSFLISDGVFPTNEDRGYVLRRLIRRAVRQSFQLGVDKLVTPALVAGVVDVMGEAYPDLARNAEFVTGVASREEERFRVTLRSGMAMLSAELEEATEAVSGAVAFRLHDTHGFPIELTREIAAERGLGVDEAGFETAMASQRELSKGNGRDAVASSADRVSAYRSILDEHGPTTFVGYTDDTAAARVLDILDAPAGPDGDARFEVFLDVTPFYAEGGGQVGDTGIIETDGGRARVIDTTVALAGLTRHLAVLEEGEVRAGQAATAVIDVERRAAIRRNHTGTHLLHWALRTVLGDHVKQQGSLVAPDRLRFDFTHYGPLADDEIARIEDLVNDQILSDPDVRISEMSRAEADGVGAIAFFEEKYGDRVRVISAGPLSTELCGGTHVARLGQIGPLEIVSEGSIGSNLRRVEATTGTATLARLRSNERTIAGAAGLLKARPDELTTAIERKLAELRAADLSLRAARQSALAGTARALAGQASDGILVARADGLAGDQLRELAAQVRDLDGVHTVVLGGSPDGAKVALVAVVAGDQKLGAPDLIADAARTVGGGGGGKNPALAMAGGRDPSRLDEALDGVRAKLGLAG
jgi:alanyl-tRNA synthetase